MSLHYSLDSLLVRGRRIFGWGFCLDTSGALRCGELVVRMVDGRSHALAVLPGGYREDLVAAHPEVPHAGGAGFLVQAVLPQPAATGSAMLRFQRADGSVLEIPLEEFPHAYAPPQAIGLRAVWHRFGQVRRQRGLLAALSAAARGLRQRMEERRSRTTAIPMAALDGAVVVFDHGMGGGANRYRDERVAALRSCGHPVVVVAPRPATLDYVLERHSSDPTETSVMPSLQELLAALSLLPARAIEINDLVGFDDVPAVLAWIVAWRRARPDRHLRFNLHDFHSVCPAFTLVDEAGRFCGIPDLARCRQCLPANAPSTLGLDTHRDVGVWRRDWRELLEACDEIVAFSASSVALLLRAHPGLPASCIAVRPHEAATAGLRRVVAGRGPPVVIAVVGHVNRAKGADLLRAMAREAEASAAPLRFVVFGTLEGGNGGLANLRVLGRYARDELCDRLEAEATTLALLPSICPETYSYVTDELMATGLPLAVLDRGAPAERVALYPHGKVLSGDDPAALLAQLRAFADALRAGDPSELRT